MPGQLSASLHYSFICNSWMYSMILHFSICGQFDYVFPKLLISFNLQTKSPNFSLFKHKLVPFWCNSSILSKIYILLWRQLAYFFSKEFIHESALLENTKQEFALFLLNFTGENASPNSIIVITYLSRIFVTVPF